MQIAAANPRWVTREEVPAETATRERAIYADQVKGKPANITEKIVDGKMEKFYEDTCLVDQVYVKDSGYKIKQLVKEFAGKVGENIVIRRFARFAVGEETA